MPSLKQKLPILLEDAARIAVVGIGSDLRGDDAAGLLALDHLRRSLKKTSRGKNRRRSIPLVKLFNGGTAPENLTGEIRRFRPGHLVMLDAVELGKSPGTIALVDVGKEGNTVFLTHKLPVRLMIDFMKAEMTFKTVFIGIQPKSLDFGARVSKPVLRAARQTAVLLASAFRSRNIRINVAGQGPSLSGGKRRTSNRRR